MAISVRCDCGKSLRANDAFAGRNAKCPACGRVLNIPPVDRAVQSPGPIIAAPVEPITPQLETTLAIPKGVARLQMADIAALGIRSALVATVIALPCLIIVGFLMDIAFAVVLPTGGFSLMGTLGMPLFSPIVGPLMAASLKKAHRRNVAVASGETALAQSERLKP